MLLDDLEDLLLVKRKASQEVKGQKGGHQKKEWEFDYPSFGDFLNLWYVGLTRAKKLLSVPSKFRGVYDCLTQLPDWPRQKEMGCDGNGNGNGDGDGDRDSSTELGAGEEEGVEADGEKENQKIKKKKKKKKDKKNDKFLMEKNDKEEITKSLAVPWRNEIKNLNGGFVIEGGGAGDNDKAGNDEASFGGMELMEEVMSLEMSEEQNLKNEDANLFSQMTSSAPVAWVGDEHNDTQITDVSELS